MSDDGNKFRISSPLSTGPALEQRRQIPNLAQIGKQAQIGNLGEKGDTPAEVAKAGEEFEALLLHQMLKAMWSTVPKGGLLDSREEEYYRDMLNEAVANNIAAGQGIGIKEVIRRDLKKFENR